MIRVVQQAVGPRLRINHRHAGHIAEAPLTVPPQIGLAKMQTVFLVTPAVPPATFRSYLAVSSHGPRRGQLIRWSAPSATTYFYGLLELLI